MSSRRKRNRFAKQQAAASASAANGHANGHSNGHAAAPPLITPPGGFRHAGRTYREGEPLPARYARVLSPGQTTSLDPARGIPDAPPNFGRDVLPQVITFSGRTSTIAQVYRNSDLAYQQSPDNARIMRNDTAIMECVEARKRGVALLGYHLDAEDADDPQQKKLCLDVMDLLAEIPEFTEYRSNMLDATWFGRHANQHAYGWDQVKGQRRCVIKRWKPINGDKLVFRYDDGTGKFSGDEVGIKVGMVWGTKDTIAGNRKIEYTDQGPCYFLEPWERSRIAIHKHIIEDGVYEDATSAGRIHGVGIRDRIYWCWFQKQQTMAHLMDVIERTGTGFTIYYYPAGDDKAKQAVQQVAENSNYQNVILFPRIPGDPAADGYGIERIEPSTQGIAALKEIIHEFFGHQIKRYILGQTLSSESAATGLGSGVAMLHQDTFLQIIQYDAVKLEETLTQELVRPLIDFNFPWARGIKIRFKIDTESNESEKKLLAVKGAWEMGLKLKAADVYKMIGMGKPDADDEVLANPAMSPMAGGMAGPGGMPGDVPPGGGQPGDGSDEPGSIEDLFGPLANSNGDGGEDPGNDRQGGSDGKGGPGGPKPLPPGGKQRYAAAADARWKTKHRPGDTMEKNGVTYRLNSNHRWELAVDDQDRAKHEAATDTADFTPGANAGTEAGNAGGKTPKNTANPAVNAGGPKEAGQNFKQPGEKSSNIPGGENPTTPADDHTARHTFVTSKLANVDPKISGIIRAFHASPAYQQGGEVAAMPLAKEQAGELHGWISQSAAKGGGPPIIMPDGQQLQSANVGGGIAVDFGDGRVGFASEAGSVVLWQDGRANYTSRTGIVSRAAGLVGGGKPGGGQPGISGNDPNVSQKPPIVSQNGGSVSPNGAIPNGQQSTGATPQGNQGAAGIAGANQAAPAPAPQAVGQPPAVPPGGGNLPPANPAGESPFAPVDNPHRGNADAAHSAWQQSIMGMQQAIQNGADGKQLAAHKRYVSSQRHVWQEHERAATFHDKQQSRKARGAGGKPVENPTPGGTAAAPPAPAPGSLSDADKSKLREMGIDPEKLGGQLQERKPQATVDPSRPKFGSEEDKAAAAADAAATAERGAKERAAMAAKGIDPSKPATTKGEHLASVAKGFEGTPLIDSPPGLEGGDVRTAAVQEPLNPPSPSQQPGGSAEAQAFTAPAETPSVPAKPSRPPKNPDEWKSHVARRLADHGLHGHEKNIAAVQSAIDAGEVKNPAELKRVLAAAAKSHQKGDVNLDSHEHVRTALSRKANRAPRQSYDDVVKSQADAWDMSPDDYRSLADDMWSDYSSHHQERESAKDHARQSTGFTAADINRLENQGLDHASDHPKIRGAKFDQVAGEMAAAYPSLGWFSNRGEGGTEEDHSEKLWNLLREGKGELPSKTSEEFHAHIGEFLASNSAGSSGGVSGSILTDEQRAAPFSATWREGYRKWLYGKRPIKPMVGQHSMLDESKHPRGMPENKGEFRPKDAAPAATQATEPFSLANPTPRGKGEEFQNLGGKQEKMWHGMDDLPGQASMFEGLDLAGPAVKDPTKNPIDPLTFGNPGYGVKNYPAVGGGLKDAKPIDSAHVPPPSPEVQKNRDAFAAEMGSEGEGEPASSEPPPEKPKKPRPKDIQTDNWDDFDKLNSVRQKIISDNTSLRMKGRPDEQKEVPPKPKPPMVAQLFDAEDIYMGTVKPEELEDHEGTYKRIEMVPAIRPPRRSQYSKPTPSELSSAISTAALSTSIPSPGQSDAGNYRKGKFNFHGLTISIESPQGTIRKPGWSPLTSHYGYINRTEGGDGENVDCFIGPTPESEIVFIVDQQKASGEFDEHKVMLGFTDETSARDGYLANYPAGWKCGPITAMPVEKFKEWLSGGDTTKPLAPPQAASPQVAPQSPTLAELSPTDLGKIIGEQIAAAMATFSPVVAPAPLAAAPLPAAPASPPIINIAMPGRSVKKETKIERDANGLIVKTTQTEIEDSAESE